MQKYVLDVSYKNGYSSMNRFFKMKPSGVIEKHRAYFLSLKSPGDLVGFYHPKEPRHIIKWMSKHPEWEALL